MRTTILISTIRHTSLTHLFWTVRSQVQEKTRASPASSSKTYSLIASSHLSKRRKARSNWLTWWGLIVRSDKGQATGISTKCYRPRKFSLVWLTSPSKKCCLTSCKTSPCFEQSMISCLVTETSGVSHHLCKEVEMVDRSTSTDCSWCTRKMSVCFTSCLSSMRDIADHQAASVQSQQPTYVAIVAVTQIPLTQLSNIRKNRRDKGCKRH